MAYILKDERENNDSFHRYRQYLKSVENEFPKSAYALANADWYFNPEDHKCPHDAWLEEVSINEQAYGERSHLRYPYIKIRLFGAYHDGFIELTYPQVFSYKLYVPQTPGAFNGHGDWRYDEFRLSDKGNLLHEIEWSNSKETGTWLIEASDVLFQWIPKNNQRDL